MIILALLEEAKLDQPIAEGFCRTYMS